MSILGDVFGLDGIADKSIVEYNGNINLTKAALVCTDKISTVSQRYADEIQTEFYSSGLHYVLHVSLWSVDLLPRLVQGKRSA